MKIYYLQIKNIKIMDITVEDLRFAISYVYKKGVNVDYFADLTDAELLKLDFSKNLQMGNIRVLNVIIELERIHNLGLPLELYRLVNDNTVGALKKAINRYLNKNN